MRRMREAGHERAARRGGQRGRPLPPAGVPARAGSSWAPHLDTVRNAGKYDGALGVMLPIACLRSLHARGERLDYPVDVIAFGDEEGLRFQATLIGSRAVAGDFDPALLGAVDEDGVRLHEALRAFGPRPGCGGRSRLPPGGGRRLRGGAHRAGTRARSGGPAGRSGDLRGRRHPAPGGRVIGRAGHAGTVPMHLRRGRARGGVRGGARGRAESVSIRRARSARSAFSRPCRGRST